MAGVHMLIGLGEAVITTLVVAAVARGAARAARAGRRAPTRGRARCCAAAQGLVVALGLALFVAPFASGWPDGLERVAARLGFEHRAAAALVPSPAARLRRARDRSAAVATVVAGGVGTLVAFALAWLLAALLAPRRLRAATRERRGTPREPPRCSSPTSRAAAPSTACRPASSAPPRSAPWSPSSSCRAAPGSPTPPGPPSCWARRCSRGSGSRGWRCGSSLVEPFALGVALLSLAAARRAAHLRRRADPRHAVPVGHGAAGGHHALHRHPARAVAHPRPGAARDHAGADVPLPLPAARRVGAHVRARAAAARCARGRAAGLALVGRHHRRSCSCAARERAERVYAAMCARGWKT